ncbi:fatty acyl-AMP ligase [Pleurocapsa sp. PCC 7319]|uniref:fatty acyl-AMP ligase n=1 Tax=Pleurocapsa sp. PCC 7319 TaxID=118161 RepID=UPI0003466CC9|nr:fatty acyl-AMP ligase [Pleurocapsa sp. PCC 7319]
MKAVQGYSSIVEILQKQAITQPDATAYIWLEDGENKTTTLSYKELELQAKAIAIQLRKYAVPGSRVLIAYPYSTGLDFITAFFGCLYAGVVAVPCHPPLNRLTIAEMKSRLVSAEIEIILTNSSLFSKLQKQLAEVGSSLHWLNTDNLHPSDSQELDNWQPPKLDSHSLAFLQYTSGSTGEPKGVMITHDCLLQNQEMLRLSFGHSKQSLGVGWLPLFHDMGLIGNVIQPIYLGISCVLMSPVNFVQKPLRWLQAISKYKATTSGAPNFAYDLLCDRVKDEQLAQLDLSSWEVAFCGAEPVQESTIERFSRKFASCGFRQPAFYPCYGMAEATLLITGGSKEQAPKFQYLDRVALEQNQVVFAEQYQPGVASVISNGHPWLDGKLAIVDPQTQTKCNSDTIGEIWFSSSCIGQGYWQSPQKTQATFQAYLQDSQAEKYLRTGDLGFIHQGELYITGRLNDVMVFWGLNHYPQNIEQTVEQCHPALKANNGAALSVKVEGQNRLVIVQEIERSYRKCLVPEEVIEAIRWAVFQEHFIDVYAIALLKPGALPKTSSGKVKRSACKEKFLSQNLAALHTWYISDVRASDVTALWQRYTNPLTYLRIFAAIARGRLRRWLFLFLKV